MNAVTEKRVVAASVHGWMPESVATCNEGNISYTVKRNDGLSLWLSFANEFFPHMNILTSAIYQKMRLYSHGGYILKSIL